MFRESVIDGKHANNESDLKSCKYAYVVFRSMEGM